MHKVSKSFKPSAPASEREPKSPETKKVVVFRKQTVASIEQCDQESFDRSPDLEMNSSPARSSTDSKARSMVKSRNSDTLLVMRPILIN